VEESASTPVPQVVTEPPATIHPGPLRIMAPDLGTERFASTFVESQAVQYFARVMHGFLIDENERQEFVPGIATDWSISTDGLTWSFTIREGLKWQDGSDLTAEDIAWSLTYHYGPQASEYTTSADQQYVSRVADRVELSGPNTVDFITTEPVVEMADNLKMGGGVKVREMLPKRDEPYNEAAALAYDENPIGAGPMRLVNHVQLSVMEFERFDDYYFQPKYGLPEDRRVNFQSLELHPVPEEATRVAAVRSGQADIVPASLTTRGQVEAGGGRMVFGPEANAVEGWALGCWLPEYPCHDKRVRQALDYAIDKELIRDRLFGGSEVFEVKGWHVVTPSTGGYTPSLDPRPYDPDKARQMLADAGYPGGEGFGKYIVNSYPSSSMPFLPELAQLVADMWRQELGIETEVVLWDRVASSQHWRAGDFEGQFLWRDNATRVDYTASLSNWWGEHKSAYRPHEDPEIWRLVNETVFILDPEERIKKMEEVLPILWEEAHILGVGYLHLPWAVGPRVLSWEPYPVAISPTALHTITLE